LYCLNTQNYPFLYRFGAVYTWNDLTEQDLYNILKIRGILYNELQWQLFLSVKSKDPDLKVNPLWLPLPQQLGSQ
jgi:hypothetical protein